MMLRYSIKNYINIFGQRLIRNPLRWERLQREIKLIDEFYSNNTH